jgi:hypothetical protein
MAIYSLLILGEIRRLPVLRAAFLVPYLKQMNPPVHSLSKNISVLSQPSYLLKDTYLYELF